MMDFIDEIKRFWNSLNLSMTEVIVFAVVVFILGVLLLSFTFILPILVFAAAIILILGLIYLIYRFLGVIKLP